MLVLKLKETSWGASFPSNRLDDMEFHHRSVCYTERLDHYYRFTCCVICNPNLNFSTSLYHLCLAFHQVTGTGPDTVTNMCLLWIHGQQEFISFWPGAWWYVQSYPPRLAVENGHYSEFTWTVCRLDPPHALAAASCHIYSFPLHVFSTAVALYCFCMHTVCLN